MNKIEIFNWIAWGLVMLWALGKAFHIRRIMRNGYFPSPPIRLASFTFWILLIIFLLVDYPKVHIIWLAILCELIFRWGQIVFPWPFIPLMPVTRIYVNLLAFNIPRLSQTNIDFISEKRNEDPEVISKKPPLT